MPIPASRRSCSLAACRGAVLEHRRLGHLEDDLRSARRPASRMIASTSSTKSGWLSCRAEMLTLTRERAGSTQLVPRARPAGRPRSSTQRPISRIESDSSASRMKSSGPIRPRSGCSQRTSASTPDHPARRELDDRLVLERRTRGPRSRARGRPTAGRAPPRPRASSGSKTTTRPLPRALAEYIATSALRSRSPAVSMPRPAGRHADAGPDVDVAARRSRRASPSPPSAGSATRSDAFMSGVSRRRTANSSPPRRAAMSLARRTDRRRSPTATSSASPAACPSVSLTSLKSSRSTNRTTARSRSDPRDSRREATTLGEQRPVGQSGQRVVRRLVVELLLELDRAARATAPAGRSRGRWPCGWRASRRASGRRARTC